MARNVLTAIIIPVKYISKYNKIYVNRGAKVMILFLFLYLCTHKLETNDKKMKKIAFIAALVALAFGAQAKVRLPHMIGDNMVLQQQTEARLGWAKPGKTIKITTSWSDETTTAKADKQGEWLAKVKTPKASYTPLSITFDDGEKLTISNVLAGEVWVCAGQSNMEMPVKGFWMCPVKDYNQVVIDAKNHGAIRSVKIPSVMSSKPLNDAQCEWRVCSPKTVGDLHAPCIRHSTSPSD